MAQRMLPVHYRGQDSLIDIIGFLLFTYAVMLVKV